MAKRPLPLYSCSQKWVKEPVNSSSFADPDARVNNENSTIVQVEDFSVQATNVTFGTFRLPEFLINFVGGTETFNLEIPEEVLAKLNETIVTSDPSYIPPTAVPAVPTPVVLAPTPASPQQPVLQAVIVEQAKIQHQLYLFPVR